MNNTQIPAKVAKAAEPVISAEEAERRRTHARVAIAENRIKGIQPSIATQRIIDAYVRGEIEARDLVTVYKNGPQPLTGPDLILERNS